MIESIWVLSIIGFFLGAPAGFSPGPMLVLIISETLRHGIRSGSKIAFVPLITDIPLLVFSGYFFSNFLNFNLLIGSISLIGSVFIFYLGIKSLFTSSLENNNFSSKTLPFKELIILNFLNPNPYLFWLTVGTPLMVRSFEKSLISGIAFLFGFYFGLVGAKYFLAIITAKSRNFMKGFWYRFTIKFLGLILIVFSIFIFLDGLDLLEII